MIKITMPKLSPTMEIGVLSAWCVKPGQPVKKGQLLAEVETDKAIMEIEAEVDGVIGYLCDVVKKPVAVNEVIGYILQENEQVVDWGKVLLEDSKKTEAQIDNNDNVEKTNIIEEVKLSSKPLESILEKPLELIDPIKRPAKLGDAIVRSDSERGDRIFISPLAKKIAELNQIDYSEIDGTGPNGRIIKRDVNDYVQSEKVGVYERKVMDSGMELIEMGKLRRIIADRMSQANREVPHVFMQKKLVIDRLEGFKNTIANEFGKKISLTPFLIKAVGLALRDNLGMNCTYENDELQRHSDVNISIAIGVADGVVVPVIRNADIKSVPVIAEEIAQYSELAKIGKLKVESMQFGTFTISNLGMYGIDSFCAIVNQPQVGILALGGAMIEAMFEEGQFVPRKMITATLSFDHRVLDGIDGAKFLQTLEKIIRSPEGLLL